MSDPISGPAPFSLISQVTASASRRTPRPSAPPPLPADSATISGAAASAAPAALTQAPVPSPVASPVSGGGHGSGAPLPGGIDLGKVFEKNPLGPYPPAEVASWQYEAKDKHSIDEIVRTSNGRVYLTADSFDTSNRKGPRGYTVAFDPQGQPLWEYQLDGKKDKGQKIHSTLCMPDGSAVVLTRSEEAWTNSHLVSLGPDGKERWRFESDSRDRLESVRPGANGTILAKTEGNLVCFDATGQQLWKTDVPMRADEFFHVVTPDGSQVLVNDNFSNNFGYDSWWVCGPDGQGRDLDLPDIGTFPLELGSQLVYGGERGEVHGVDLGTFGRWEVQTDSTRGLKTPVLGRDGNIYIEGRFDDKIYAVSPTGQKLWQATVSDSRSLGALADRFETDVDGSLYYLKDDGEGIQQIRPDGTQGLLIKVPEGVEHFKPGCDGRLYVWSTSEPALMAFDAGSGQKINTLPLAIEHPHVYDLVDVLPGGVAVLKSMDTIYNIKVDQNPGLEKELEEITQGAGAPPEPPPTIVTGDEYVVIGGVRVPVRKPVLAPS